MRHALYKSLWLLAAGGLGLSASACVGQRDQELRLSEELGRARANAAWQEARVAELDARLSRLEHPLASPPADAHLLQPRLDRLIAQNERLLAERPTACVAAPAAPATPHGAGASTSRTSSTSTSATADTGDTQSTLEEQLRTLVERLRGHRDRFRGPLTREQNEALRVLLKPERQLDSENPWY
jgi:hypothetical protein